MPQVTETDRTNIYVCPRCDEDVFECIEVQQFRAGMLLGMNQPPAPNGNKLYMLRCIYCDYLLVPNVNVTAGYRRSEREAYEDFVEHVTNRNELTEGKFARTPKPPKLMRPNPDFQREPGQKSKARDLKIGKDKKEETEE